MNHAIRCTVLGVAASLMTAWVHAQTYPVKPIRLIAPFSPGASTDVVGRLLAQGGELATGSPAEFTESIRNDVAKWNKVIRAAKMEQE